MNTEPLCAAWYARVSSEQQAQAATIDSQIAALEARAHADGYKVPDAWRFADAGYSGSTLVRPGLEALRDTAASGAIDRLYVHSPDRLSREYAYQVLLLEELQRDGVEVVFLNQSIGETPEAHLLLQVQGMIAEYERAKIMERSRRGKRHAAQRGSVNVLGGAPYGYRYVRKQDAGGQARYEVEWEQAGVVRQVFAWIGQDRHSIGDVCRRLQQQGVPSPTGKSYWDRTTIWGLLKNPAYAEKAAFGKTRVEPMRPRPKPQRNAHAQPRRPYSSVDAPRADWVEIDVPAIVDEALFAAVQEQLVENRERARTRSRGALHLLQGLVTCGCCGYAYYGKRLSPSSAKGKRHRYAYYRCIGTDAYRFGGQRVCDNGQVRTDVLEHCVWQAVTDLLANPGRLKDEYERRLINSKTPPEQDESRRLERQVAQLRKGVSRLIDGYADGLIEKTEFEPKINRLKIEYRLEDRL